MKKDKKRIAQLETIVNNQHLTIKSLKELVECIIKNETDDRYKGFMRDKYNKIITDSSSRNVR